MEATADRKAEFEALFASVMDAAYRTAYRFTHSRDDAMDLVQEAAIQAYRHFDTFEPGSNFRAWYFRILANLYFRKRSRPKIATQSLDDAEDLYLYQQALDRDGVETTADAVIDKLDAEEVQEAIDRLPDDFRETAVLYFVNQSSYEEIAEILQVPIGTVRSRLHRGRKLLQSALWNLAVARGLVTKEREPDAR